MIFIVVILGALLFFITAWIVLRFIKKDLLSIKYHKSQFHELEGLSFTLQNGRKPEQGTIDQLAAQPHIRGLLYSTLAEYKFTSLFPKQYLNFEDASEALVYFWLMHPDNLGAKPDVVEFVQQVVVDTEEGAQTCYVYKFKLNPPHELSERGWMPAVTGPYSAKDTPYASASGSFNVNESFEAKTPEEHAADTIRESKNITDL